MTRYLRASSQVLIASLKYPFSKKKLGRDGQQAEGKQREGKRTGERVRERKREIPISLRKANTKDQRGKKLGAVPKILQARGLSKGGQDNARAPSPKPKQ